MGLGKSFCSSVVALAALGAALAGAQAQQPSAEEARFAREAQDRPPSGRGMGHLQTAFQGAEGGAGLKARLRDRHHLRRSGRLQGQRRQSMACVAEVGSDGVCRLPASSHLAGFADPQRRVEEAVERQPDHALGRVLNRRDPEVHLPPLHAVEDVGDGGHRHELRAVPEALARREVREGVLWPEERDPRHLLQPAAG